MRTGTTARVGRTKCQTRLICRKLTSLLGRGVVSNPRVIQLAPAFRVLAAVFRVLAAAFRVLAAVFRVLAAAFRVLAPVFRVLAAALAPVQTVQRRVTDRRNGRLLVCAALA